ncbi:MAG: ParB-like protein partition protein [Candidatus Woesebacteria bacterium GW2011_GWB1_38_5]|uniref:ParB-like protein partition protein n=4 Tax=Candidatus Woeseibacteriota TaxID=1752722 RepID=A0A0G0NFW2_9BACT|nr:MAG: ParB-like protein partition protein [Candidatus Woesebacteria bacterium GW2011_GWD1_38_10]KKQ56239.1 MAG: ParB-like protein partition protein [Candidatus Woesebacteria bacterium GW2011_GWC1_38_13]KKQ73576.1 MAG: ParB-like protein partition protein [Candidatus Woesebacteria bacterium GW2011_GWB1_38_5]KKQ84774.1 MAG: ParB-like protein partition protein [Candidatus Woesebacteria bacterium GW2011_GWA1_38_8]
MAEEVIQIPIDQLQPNPLQPRGSITPETLVDLVDSIKEHGILEPLVVAKTPAGYQIIAGERRWRAARLAGLTHVPALIRETSPKGMLEMALVENVQRIDLNALDRAKGFERLMTEFSLSSSEISVRIGKSVAYVSNSIRLLTLPDALKDGLLSGLITEGHARALAAIDDPDLMVEAYKIILKESGSVRRAEELARRMKAKANQDMDRSSATKVIMRIVSDDIDKMQEDMTNIFANFQNDDNKKKKTSVVKLIRSQRETRIQFIFKGNLEETEERLQKLYKAVAGS